MPKLFPEVLRPPLRLRLKGEWACFTRPEFKAERMSYPVMTPSAARGCIEAVFWKPVIAWVIERIYVCAPIRWGNVRRNEVGKRMGEGGGLFIENDRQQRNTMALRDVEYVVEARFHFTEKERRPEETPAKFIECFERRVRKGQCFNQPVLGCREFAADFEPVPQDWQPEPPPDLADNTQDLGWMLLDLRYGTKPPHQPEFFHACLHRGLLTGVNEDGSPAPRLPYLFEMHPALSAQEAP